MQNISWRFALGPCRLFTAVPEIRSPRDDEYRNYHTGYPGCRIGLDVNRHWYIVGGVHSSALVGVLHLRICRVLLDHGSAIGFHTEQGCSGLSRTEVTEVGGVVIARKRVDDADTGLCIVNPRVSGILVGNPHGAFRAGIDDR